MLSRIAESLYWVGRYLERADDTTRLLEVEMHRLLEGAPGDDLPGTRALLSVMGLLEPFGEAPDFTEVTGQMAFAADQPGSIVSSLAQARENVRGIRECVPSELWEYLNATHIGLAQRVADARTRGPHGFFGFAAFVRERVAIAGGIVEATMMRDDGWRFLVLGRSVERIDMTVRLLSFRLSQPERLSDWVTTLRACSAYEAFLRTYGGRVSAAAAVEFLLLDRLCPRSAYFALSSASACLAELEYHQSRLGPADDAQRLLGRARAALEYRSIADLAPDLTSYLIDLQSTCSDVGSAIARRYFHRDATLAWRRETEGETSAPAVPA